MGRVSQRKIGITVGESEIVEFSLEAVKADVGRQVNAGGGARSRGGCINVHSPELTWEATLTRMASTLAQGPR